MKSKKVKFKILKSTPTSLTIQGVHNITNTKLDKISTYLSSSGILNERRLFYKDSDESREIILNNHKVIGVNYFNKKN